MSIKRYDPAIDQSGEYDAIMECEPDGEFVRWADYARLKAEVERLTEIIRREVDGGVDLREEAQRTVEENHNLRAEVERLRKAGDAMAREICILGPVDDKEMKAIEDWNAAKEGKPSV